MGGDGVMVAVETGCDDAKKYQVDSYMLDYKRAHTDMNLNVEMYLYKRK